MSYTNEQKDVFLEGVESMKKNRRAVLIDEKGNGKKSKNAFNLSRGVKPFINDISTSINISNLRKGATHGR